MRALTHRRLGQSHQHGFGHRRGRGINFYLDRVRIDSQQRKCLQFGQHKHFPRQTGLGVESYRPLGGVHDCSSVILSLSSPAGKRPVDLISPWTPADVSPRFRRQKNPSKPEANAQRNLVCRTIVLNCRANREIVGGNSWRQPPLGHAGNLRDLNDGTDQAARQEGRMTPPDGAHVVYCL